MPVPDLEVDSEFISGFTVLFASLIVSGWIGDDALRRLSRDEKVSLVDSSFTSQVFVVLPVMAVMFYRSTWLFGLMVGAYVLPAVLWSAHRLVGHGVPRSYARSHIAAQAVLLGGLSAFFALVVR
jgi:hypothetical protein